MLLIQRKYNHALRVKRTLFGGLDVLLSAQETGAKTASPQKLGRKWALSFQRGQHLKRGNELLKAAPIFFINFLT